MTDTRRTHIRLSMIAMLALATLGCGDRGRDPLSPDGLAISAAKRTNSGMVADVARGDLVLGTNDAPALASTCPGTASHPAYSVVFGKTLCLVVRPHGAPEGYELTDDIVLEATREKGKNGRITHIRLKGQDVNGEAGIFHDTDPIPVAQPVVPAETGFTLHVHATNVPVWRWDSHLGDGNRVEIVGTISIGDIVYRNQ